MKNFVLTIAALLLFIWPTFGQIPVPYSDNFDGVNAGWYCVTDSGSAWELGMPSYGATNSTHSGNNCWDITLDSAYENATSTKLYTPLFDFSNATGMNVSFWMNIATEDTWDGVRLEYAINGGNWNLVGIYGNDSSCRWYNYPNLKSSGLAAWCGSSNGWIQCAERLSFLDNTQGTVQFRFVFTSDLAVRHDGVSIDDFSISTTPVPLYYPLVTFNAIVFTGNLPCYNFPYLVLYNITVNTSSFSGGIPKSMYINWGDGTDTLLYTDFYFPSHLYQFPGIYSMQFIITPQIGLPSTITKNNFVKLVDSCSTISGKVYFDVDSDCVFTNGIDTVLQAFDVHTDNPNFSNIAKTNSGGVYQFKTIGSNTISIDSSVVTLCPINNLYNIPVLPSYNNDFAIKPIMAPNISTQILFGSLRPGFEGDLWFTIRNIGYVSVNSQLFVTLPVGVTFINSKGDQPDSIINTNVLVYNFQSMGFNNPKLLHIYFDCSLSLSVNQQYCFGTYASPFLGDQDTTNNIFTWCDYPASSFDPNDKHVSPAGAIPNDTVLNYRINFQNTGTASAYNIFLYDTLSNNLDITTFSLVGSSHPVICEVLNGGILKFNYYNIMLPDSGHNQAASHGFVSFKIRPKQNLANGTSITNKAAIVFDFNEAIITNATYNFIDATLVAGLANISEEQLFSIYPNPANSFLNIELKGNNEIHYLFELMDVTGRTLMSSKETKKLSVLSLELIKPGIYFYRIKGINENKFQTGKLIKNQ